MVVLVCCFLQVFTFSPAQNFTVSFWLYFAMHSTLTHESEVFKLPLLTSLHFFHLFLPYPIIERFFISLRGDMCTACGIFRRRSYGTIPWQDSFFAVAADLLLNFLKFSDVLRVPSNDSDCCQSKVPSGSVVKSI